MLDFASLHPALLQPFSRYSCLIIKGFHRSTPHPVNFSVVLSKEVSVHFTVALRGKGQGFKPVRSYPISCPQKPQLCLISAEQLEVPQPSAFGSARELSPGSTAPRGACAPVLLAERAAGGQESGLRAAGCPRSWRQEWMQVFGVPCPHGMPGAAGAFPSRRVSASAWCPQWGCSCEEIFCIFCLFGRRVAVTLLLLCAVDNVSLEGLECRGALL